MQYLREIREHAIQRAQERYGVELQHGDIITISKIIKNGDALLIRGTKNNGEYCLRWGDVTLLACFRKGQVRTFLPKQRLPLKRNKKRFLRPARCAKTTLDYKRRKAALALTSGYD